MGEEFTSSVGCAWERSLLLLWGVHGRGVYFFCGVCTGEEFFLYEYNLN
jgi:hypothetical protein